MGHKAPESLTHVGALIGVSSCKGGVGKSTIATNLAFAIAAIGGRVGLIDADVYGPSLPSLVRLEDDPNPTPNPKPDPDPNPDPNPNPNPNPNPKPNPRQVQLEDDALPLTQRGDNKLLVPAVVG